MMKIFQRGIRLYKYRMRISVLEESVLKERILLLYRLVGFLSEHETCTFIGNMVDVVDRVLMIGLVQHYPSVMNIQGIPEHVVDEVASSREAQREVSLVLDSRIFACKRFASEIIYPIRFRAI